MEQILEELKEEYEKVEPTPYLQQNGWIEIHQKMEDRSTTSPMTWFKRLAFLLILLLLPVSGTIGLVKAANASAPETPLYPVKLAIEVVVEKVTGSNELALRHRAEEIADLADDEDNSEILENVISEYAESVDKEKKKVEEEGKEEEKEDLEKHLNEHRKDFAEAVKGNPKALEGLEKAIDATGNENNNGNNENGEENGNPPEVKGKSDEEHGNSGNSGNNGKSEERGKKP